MEGEEKAAVCWHLVTVSHYCTDAIKQGYFQDFSHVFMLKCEGGANSDGGQQVELESKSIGGNC